MATKKVLLTLCFIIVWMGVYAQTNSFFTHYSSRDGLSQNAVMSILQDYKGAMWFATWDGINKFNGYTFTTYKASRGSLIDFTNNRVDHLYEDKYGYLWLHTYDNTAHRFNPNTEEFEQVPANDGGNTLHLASIKVLDNGVVWLLTDSEGAVRVCTDPKDFKASWVTYNNFSSTSAPSSFSSLNHYNQIYLDNDGNEWVLTDNGLGVVRTDSHQLEPLFVDANSELSGFYTIVEGDRELFIGAEQGVVWRYNKSDKKFSKVSLPAKSNVVSIRYLLDDLLIIATRDDGFFTFSPSTGAYTHYTHITMKALLNEPVLSVYVDRHSEAWFEQEVPGSVFHFNPFTQHGKLETLKIEPVSIDRSRPAFHIHEDVFGVLWVHPFGGGMSYFDRAQNKLLPFYNEPDGKDWIFSNRLHSAYSDKQGNLWMGTHTKGLEKVTFKRKQFYMKAPNPHLNESLSNEVRAICQDADKNIWVSYRDERLRVYDSELNYKGYLTYDGRVAKTGKSMDGVTYDIMQDRHGNMWFATKGDGVMKAVKQPDGSFKLTRFLHNANDIYSLSNNNVYSLHEDKHGRIWMATFGGGLNYLVVSKGGEPKIINHRNRLRNYPIDRCHRARFVTSDTYGNIWVGTTAGAICFPEDAMQADDISFTVYSRVPGDTSSLSNNDVHWITQTKKGEIFLATFGGGLNKLLEKDQRGNAVFQSYSTSDGLPSDMLLAIREDKNENLWISTEHGISRFTQSTGHFENFDDKNFSFRVRFSEAASEVLSDSQVLFGTSTGIFYFHPDSIYKSDYVPPILFSSLSVANRTVSPGEHSILRNSLDSTDELVLTHKENIVGFQFAALDYTDPETIQYAYILEGLDKQWNYADRMRTATYTHLPKGKYVFKVKSTNSDGAWVDNVRALKIEILPSFWETPLAYFLYILLVVVVMSVAVYVLFTIYRLKHEVVLEQKITDLKLRFFTNISHELRTPLTLITGPIDHILKTKTLPSDVREQLIGVERNTSRMLRMINQILDFRKIQNHRMKLRVRKVDIANLVSNVMESFETIAEEHHIDFLFETEQENLYLWIDEDQVEKILFNLLSNAFKYTPKGKAISVFIGEDQDTISLEVRDQGFGIDEKRQKVIFDRFENFDEQTLFKESSTGIGLALVKELVELHGATISVDSKPGEGSCFKVKFLKGKEHYDQGVDFILEDGDTPLVVDGDAEPVTTEEDADTHNDTISPSHALPLMLLVEDNYELRKFLIEVFAAKYKIIEAPNGNDGLEKALKLIPDIIITDLMMPGKNGYQLTKALRENMTTSHIPIILLTAKTDMESQLEGFEIGADDYITKPFSATFLQAKVDNLLAQRSKLRDLYRQTLMNDDVLPAHAEEVEKENRGADVNVSDLTPVDRKFMEKLLSLMEQHMDNGELIVDDLVRELAVSRSVFFKKLKTLTGLSPIEFIKEMRIKRAAQLIEMGEFSMTQIAYMVGINDPRYFSKCFKQKYRITPTEYRDSLGKNNRR